MRLLDRNKQTVYYAVYQGKTKAVDSEGLYTGENEISYGDVVKDRMKVGVNKGNSQLEQFGINDPFTNLILTDDMNCPVNTAAIMWLGLGDVDEVSESETYAEGDLAIKDGTIQKYTSEEWQEVPHTHAVLRVSKALNHILILAREVEVSL